MIEVDQKIFSILEELKNKGTITYDTDFCDLIDLKKQNFQRIKKGDVHFTVKHIKKICSTFQIDPRFIYGYSDKMFMNIKNIGNQSTM